MKSRFEAFKITDKNGCEFYGGDQDWYLSNTRAMAGCSSVAGANALRALAKSNRSSHDTLKDSKRMSAPIRRALLSDKCSKDDFVLLMTDVYSVMRSFEIFPLNKIYDQKERNNKFFKKIKPNNGRSSIGFIQGVLLYAGRLGLCLKCNALPTAFMSKDKADDFIKRGLKSSGAVVILTSYNEHSIKTKTGICKMKCHFATITDISGDEITISTWGKEAKIDFNELVSSWHSIKAWESTLFYFEKAEKPEMIKSLLLSPLPFMKGIIQAIIRKAAR